jgi:hypothetical protein
VDVPSTVFSAKRLQLARAVLAAAPELAKGVLDGSEHLDKAYETVRDRQGKADNHAVRLRSLTRERPDLAELVTDEKLTLQDAEQRAKTEAETHKKQRATYTMNMLEAVAILDREPEHAADFQPFYDPAIAATMAHEPITPIRLMAAAAYLSAILETMKKKEKNKWNSPRNVRRISPIPKSVRETGICRGRCRAGRDGDHHPPLSR